MNNPFVGKQLETKGVALPIGKEGSGLLYTAPMVLSKDFVSPIITKGGDPDFLALLDEIRELHVKKAQDYGSDEDPLANIKACEEIGIPAWKGAWVRARDKVKRIDRYCMKGELANESVEDSFKDLAAYSLLALVCFRRRKE